WWWRRRRHHPRVPGADPWRYGVAAGNLIVIVEMMWPRLERRRRPDEDVGRYEFIEQRSIGRRRADFVARDGRHVRSHRTPIHRYHRRMSKLLSLLVAASLSLPLAGCIVATRSRGQAVRDCPPAHHWDGYGCVHNGRGRGNEQGDNDDQGRDHRRGNDNDQ